MQNAHLTDVGYPTGQEDFPILSEAEQKFARFIQQWSFTESAYLMLQGTKPQSLAYALNDSPVASQVLLHAMPAKPLSRNRRAI